MKVTISVAGRFHAFYLAQQLLKRGFLDRLITSYPRFEVLKYGIPRDKIRSILIKEILIRGWQRLPGFAGRIYDPNFLIAEIYDWLAMPFVLDSDIFVGWSSKSLHSLRRAKKNGSIVILERGSSHIVYNNHILQEEYDRWGVKKMAVHPGIIEKEMREYEEADYICIPSLFVEGTFLGRGIPKDKLIRIPYGVDLREFEPVSKKDNVFRVVYVGGMTIQKGVHYLLRAFHELRLPNAELFLVGGLEDEMRPFFKEYEGSFRYIGIVPQNELINYYSQSSVFVLNSIQDGFGMVLIQAMAAGLPVIATTNTGGMDVVRDGIEGFIIPIRDVEALKEKILYFYKNPDEAEKMGVAAREKVRKGFTWDDYGEKIVNAYLLALRNKK